jgi:hypothetical protein
MRVTVNFLGEFMWFNNNNLHMKGIITEKGLVPVLFVLVLIAFSFAQKESKKVEDLYYSVYTAKKSAEAAVKIDTHKPAVKN